MVSVIVYCVISVAGIPDIDVVAVIALNVIVARAAYKYVALPGETDNRVVTVSSAQYRTYRV